MRLSAASGVYVLEVIIVGANQSPDKKKQNDLTHEQRYTIEKITFVVEPRFQTTGDRTIGSVLLKLMQYEVET